MPVRRAERLSAFHWRCNRMSEKDTVLSPEMDKELSNGKGDDEDE
jgi:hypothetical protein